MKSIKYRKTNLAAAVLLLAAAVLIAGCATVTPAGDEEMMNVISLINSGSSERLTELSAESFLLDSEILHGSAIIGELWSGLAEAGFMMTDPVIIESRPVSAADKKLFDQNTEVDAFFSKYIPAQSVLFRIGTDEESYVIILGPSEKNPGRIIAFGGPY